MVPVGMETPIIQPGRVCPAWAGNGAVRCVAAMDLSMTSNEKRGCQVKKILSMISLSVVLCIMSGCQSGQESNTVQDSTEILHEEDKPVEYNDGSDIKIEEETEENQEMSELDEDMQGSGEIPCPECSGTGAASQCANCGGTGYDTDTKQVCVKCFGAGEKFCERCKGWGMLNSSGYPETPSVPGGESDYHIDVNGSAGMGNGEQTCPYCMGGKKKCDVCNGSGLVERYNSAPYYGGDSSMGKWQNESCTGCSGQGYYDCPVCGGDGKY